MAFIFGGLVGAVATTLLLFLASVIVAIKEQDLYYDEDED